MEAKVPTESKDSKEQQSDHFSTIKSLILSSVKALLNAENKRIALVSISQ